MSKLSIFKQIGAIFLAIMFLLLFIVLLLSFPTSYYNVKVFDDGYIFDKKEETYGKNTTRYVYVKNKELKTKIEISSNNYNILNTGDTISFFEYTKTEDKYDTKYYEIGNKKSPKTVIIYKK